MVNKSLEAAFNHGSHRFNAIDDIANFALNEGVVTDVDNPKHAFVVLGYALSSTGEIQDPLLGRLQVAQRAAESCVNSRIIVSGGSPKHATAEADVMYDWLTQRGVDGERIAKESDSLDTVENALNSRRVMAAIGIKSATLITSASHMRRALALFLEADEELRTTSHIVHPDNPDAQLGFMPGERQLLEEGLRRITQEQRRQWYRCLGSRALSSQ